MYQTTEGLNSVSIKNLRSFSQSLVFITNQNLTSNFELKSSPDIYTNVIGGVGSYYFDALIGSTLNIKLSASYGRPTVIIFNDTGKGIIASMAEDGEKEATLDFVAPRTGAYYLGIIIDPSDKNASFSVLEDQDTSPAYIPPAPKPVITPIPTPTDSEIVPVSTNKQLVGTTKSDNLIGGDGNDTLTGGLEFDTLTGGKGADKFVYKSIKDAPVSHSKIEVITDFSHSDGDKINLSAIDANTSIAKDQAFSKPEMGAEFSGVFTKAGQLFFDTTTHILYGTVNNDGAASFAIQLNGVTSLVAGDFIL